MKNIEPLLKKIDNVLITSGYRYIDLKPPDFNAVYVRVGKVTSCAFLVKDITLSPYDRQSIR